MNGQQLLLGVGFVDEKFVNEAECKIKIKRNSYLWWKVAAACFAVVMAISFIVLPNYRKKNTPAQHKNPNELIADHTNDSIKSDLPEKTRGIQISMSNIYINEISGFKDASRIMYDPELYHEAGWKQEDILRYYGKDLTPAYIPKELMAAPQNGTARVFMDNENKIVEDDVWLQYYTDYYEDGSPKQTSGIPVCKGFTLVVSKLGILKDCIYLAPEDKIEVSNIEGTDVTIGHKKAPYGPYHEETHEPSGYYDMYVIEFTLDGKEYRMIAEQVELEEVVKIVTSVITGENEIEVNDFTRG